MNPSGIWGWDTRSSKEWKQDWIEAKVKALIQGGHTRKFAREKAKQLYRELSR